jgi:putative aldouronate transport system substrate-binding protein
MKRAAKVIALAMASAIAGAALTGCGGTAAASTASTAEKATGASASDTGSDYTITMAYIGNEQPNQEAVFAKLNELTQEKLGMSLDLVRLDFGNYTDKLNLMLSGGDKLDILPVYFTQASSYINAGQIVNLADYMDKDGQDIIKLMGEDVAKSGAVNGFIYGIPSNKESAPLAGVVMRKDIVDELGIDVDSIHTYDDLTPIYEKVKAAHPELDMVAGTNMVAQIQNYDPLSDSFGVLMDNGQSTKVENFYETEEYKTRVKRISDWYKAGYVKLDAATTTETVDNLVKAGTLFSFIQNIKPAYLVQENVACGQEMVTAYIGNDDGTSANTMCTNNVNFFDWGIAAQSQDKEKAMKFLNFAYSSPEFNNLINFGIEGEDYEKVSGSDTYVDFPSGKDATSAYHLNEGWLMPNQFIGYVWNGQPEDIWSQYQKFNSDATKSAAFGFLYDSSSVSTELTALMSVQTEYAKSLETGSVSDVDATLKEYNDKLYAAGLQKVMDLKQQQLDQWLADNKG